MPSLPLVALTLGDVAGIGPEVAVKACLSSDIRANCLPLLVGDATHVQKGLDLAGSQARIRTVWPGDATVLDDHEVLVWNPSTVDLKDVNWGQIDGRAGKAAYDWLVAATRAALEGRISAIVTAPLNKAALHAGGIHYPGHTEILAAECGIHDFAMMLYLPAGLAVQGPHGLGVAHVTLHTSIASVPGLLNTGAILQKIHLVNRFLQRIGCRSPRVGVCALNPHAGEEGLFGDEESRIILPAVEAASREGVMVTGPLPADTLLKRAVQGEFDGVVAMYHDQGHIALKLIGFNRAVNVTLGLPIVRTSPSHGTAFDIAGRGLAESAGMEQAIQVAVRLATGDGKS
jgi:4-hydroxythreonine-4-phosphate dehydrogenase